MLNVRLLKEGRFSRPQAGFSVVGFISLFLILLSTGAYLLAYFVSDVRAFVDNFRIIITVLGVEFDYAGIVFLKMMVCIPLSVLGAIIGGINLIRITNRKPFLSILHVIPRIGLIGTILGFAAHYFLSFFFKQLPIEFDLKILYYVYVYSVLAYAGGIAFADIFALFYSHLNAYEFWPIYRAYRRAKKEARKNSERSLIRYNFKRYWKQRRYDDLLALLFGHNIHPTNKEERNDESYLFLRNRALKKVENEKIAELDALYESGQHDLLRKELASMELEKSEPAEYVPEKIEKKGKQKAADELPSKPMTIEVDDGEEELTRYGRKQIEKGRRKAMREARRHHAY